MLLFGLFFVGAGIIYALRELREIAQEQRAIRAEIAELRTKLLSGLSDNVHMLTDVVELHLAVPPEKRVFKKADE